VAAAARGTANGASPLAVADVRRRMACASSACARAALALAWRAHTTPTETSKLALVHPTAAATVGGIPHRNKQLAAAPSAAAEAPALVVAHEQALATANVRAPAPPAAAARTKHFAWASQHAA